MKIEKKFLHLIHANGALLLLVFVALVVINPAKPAKKMPPGFFSTVVALELVESPSEVRDITGGDYGMKAAEGESDLRDRFRTGTLLDYAFIPSYVCFNIMMLFFLMKAGTVKKPAFYAAIAAGLLAGFADHRENMIILNILGQSAAIEVLKDIQYLQGWTYLKWELLALLSMLIGMGLFSWKKKGTAVIFFLAFLCGVLGLSRREAIEWQSLAMAAGWLVFLFRTLPLRSAWFQAD